MKKYLFIALGALLFFATGCTSEPEPAPVPDEPGDTPIPDIITGSIEMEDGGVITFELYHDIAPQSVRNFVNLAQEGFYDGLRFHRIMPDFMIQGGCPYTLDFSGNPGTGNPGYSIFGEFADNDFENSLSHTRGVMSMARGNDYNSAGSQFFICHGNPEFLNGRYAAFGIVTEGMDVVDGIAGKVPFPGGVVTPDEMPVIRRITIDGNVRLPEPDKLAR
jgi:peptidyl-prolyl cis-trans isomerase B (cyclophilin B)